jgi:hypothetical protein
MPTHRHVQRRFADPAEAFARARSLAGETLDLVGDFVIPPAGGPPSRDFQTLHFDFALPVHPRGPADVGLFTALHVPAGTPRSGAATRLVDLGRLGGAWPADAPARLRASGVAAEGSFARIAEAVLTGRSTLPPLGPQFLCGTEFATLDAEVRFLERLGLDVSAATTEIVIEPGELLVFDNLAVAHGRRGLRRPGELRQWVFGKRAMAADDQCRVRDRVLGALAAA